ncbi:MAG: SDR family oxidoreductase [Proteobacteria bacterium]|nr:SDR family oxidoreductase [Pseudomonadota bacterium]
MQIQGKTIVVTGGGRGLGRAMALEFARRGGAIALVDLNPADLEKTRAEVAALGVAARAYACNVTQEDAVVATMDAIVRDFGSLDVLVNNAGIVKDGLLIKVKDGAVVGKMGLDQWNAVIGVNLTGVFLCGREAAERMVRGGHGGVIINISSISKDGNAGQTNYTAAKAGVAAMATTWAKELARFGIRVGAIAPGYCATDILSGMTPETLAKVTAPVPLKRLGEPAEIAQTAVFIVENDFFTGRTVQVDGGLRI